MTGMDMLNALHIQGDETIAARLEKYNELIMEKNRVMNLTGIKDGGESLIKNVYDSLTVFPTGRQPSGFGDRRRFSGYDSGHPQAGHAGSAHGCHP